MSLMFISLRKAATLGKVNAIVQYQNIESLNILVETFSLF